MTSLPKPSVLIVDDEPALRLGLRASFALRGWSTEVASGVQSALAAQQRRSFDLVLSDICMQDGDGFQLLTALHTSDPPPAVLFLTAFGSVPDAVRAMRHGAVDYLIKPVCFDQLLAVALQTMEKRHTTPLAPAHSLPTTQSSNGRMPSNSREVTSASDLSLSQIERAHMERTLAQVGGNRTRAAELLGISVRTMRNKIREYDLPPRRYA